jgi:hypothetical protein
MRLTTLQEFWDLFALDTSETPVETLIVPAIKAYSEKELEVRPLYKSHHN